MQDNFIRPFQLDKAGLRGRLVRLGGTVDEILGRHGYPLPVSGMLGQAVALSAILAGALKFDGVFTLQTKGNGPVGMLVADFASPGQMRGYAQYDKARMAELMEKDAASRITVPQVLGAGYVAFTVDQGEDMERYQGIVELQGSSLAECAHQYFRESEQIQTAIRVACQQVNDADGQPNWRAGAIMIQRLPIGDPAMQALKDDELTDEKLAADQLLFRLFHEEDVRAFEPTALEFGCRCSADRAEGVLGSLAKNELEDLAIDGELSVTCEFCNSSYVYDLAQFNN
jgi:molecular chaperone Hsp33